MTTTSIPVFAAGIGAQGPWTVTSDTVQAAAIIRAERNDGATVTARYFGNEQHAIVDLTRNGYCFILGIVPIFDKDDASWSEQLGLSAAEVTEATA